MVQSFSVVIGRRYPLEKGRIYIQAKMQQPRASPANKMTNTDMQPVKFNTKLKRSTSNAHYTYIYTLIPKSEGKTLASISVHLASSRIGQHSFSWWYFVSRARLRARTLPRDYETSLHFVTRVESCSSGPLGPCKNLIFGHFSWFTTGVKHSRSKLNNQIEFEQVVGRHSSMMLKMPEVRQRERVNERLVHPRSISTFLGIFVQEVSSNFCRRVYSIFDG